MTINRIDHIGINFNDLAAAKAFFLDLGFEVEGEAKTEGAFLDSIVGLKGAKTEFAMVRLPNGGTKLELIKYLAPADPTGIQPLPANAHGIRHIAFPVDDVDAVVAKAKAKGMELVGELKSDENWKLCYIRGPEGIILELAEELK